MRGAIGESGSHTSRVELPQFLGGIILGGNQNGRER
jgi:hypothetical protein